VWIFEVSFFYQALSSLVGFSFPWRSKAPSRVAFFVSTATLRRILTLDNLRKGQVIVIDWYCVCKKSREFIDHRLFHHEIARDFCTLISFFWDRVGNALMGGEVFGKLERLIGSHHNLEA
jgi:hypothetical protein